MINEYLQFLNESNNPDQFTMEKDSCMFLLSTSKPFTGRYIAKDAEQCHLFMIMKRGSKYKSNNNIQEYQDKIFRSLMFEDLSFYLDNNSDWSNKGSIEDMFNMNIDDKESIYIAQSIKRKKAFLNVPVFYHPDLDDMKGFVSLFAYFKFKDITKNNGYIDRMTVSKHLSKPLFNFNNIKANQMPAGVMIFN